MGLFSCFPCVGPSLEPAKRASGREEQTYAAKEADLGPEQTEGARPDSSQVLHDFHSALSSGTGKSWAERLTHLLSVISAHAHAHSSLFGLVETDGISSFVLLRQCPGGASSSHLGLLYRMLEAQRPITQHVSDPSSPCSGDPDSTAFPRYASASTLVCAIPLFEGSRVAGALLLEAAAGPGPDPNPLAGPGAGPLPAACKTPTDTTTSPHLSPLLSSPAMLQQLGLAASVCGLGADAEQLRWTSNALSRITSANSMHTLVWELCEDLAAHVKRRFFVTASVRAALLPHPDATVGLLFHPQPPPPPHPTSSHDGGGGGPGGGRRGDGRDSALRSARSSVEGVGGAMSVPGGGVAVAASGASAAAAGRLGGMLSSMASRHRLNVLMNTAGSVGSDCGTARFSKQPASSNLFDAKSTSSARTLALATDTTAAAAAAAARFSLDANHHHHQTSSATALAAAGTETASGSNRNASPPPSRAIVVQLPASLSSDAVPTPSLHAQAFPLKHTMLLALATAASATAGVAGEEQQQGAAASFCGASIEDVAVHVQNVHNPSRDVCLLAGYGGTRLGSGLSVLGTNSPRAPASSSHCPSPFYSAAAGLSALTGGGAAASPGGLQSLVLVGLRHGGESVLALYLCFPKRLPGELLEAVRASCNELLEQMFLAPVCVKLDGSLAPEFEALRTTTPGHFAVLRHPSGNGLLPPSHPHAHLGQATAHHLASSLLQHSHSQSHGLPQERQQHSPHGHGSHQSALPHSLSQGTGSGQQVCRQRPLSQGVIPKVPTPGASATASRTGTGLGVAFIPLQEAQGRDAPGIPTATASASRTISGRGHLVGTVAEAGMSASGGAVARGMGGRGSGVVGAGGAAAVAARRASVDATCCSSIPSGLDMALGGNKGARGAGGHRLAASCNAGGGALPQRNSGGSGSFEQRTCRIGTGAGAARGCIVATQVADLTDDLLSVLLQMRQSETATGEVPALGGGGSTEPQHSASIMTVVGVETCDMFRRQQLDMLVNSIHTTMTAEAINNGSTAPFTDDLEQLELHEVLGRGGGGIVYRGRMGTQEVAVKVMELPDVDAGEQVLNDNNRNRNGNCPGNGNGNGAAAALPRAHAARVAGGGGGGGGGLLDPKAAAALVATAQLRARRALLRNAMEMAVQGRVSHPNIVQVYAAYSNVTVERRVRPDGGISSCLVSADNNAPDLGVPTPTVMHCAIVTELADGGSLAAALAARAFPRIVVAPGSLPPDHRPFMLDLRGVYMVLLDVALALRHLHSMHLVHRDLKPANLLLNSNPRDYRGFTVKLADFGFVLHLSETADNGTRFVNVDQACGTVTHMAPELLPGKARVEASADIYSFGILMWELVAGGVRPFPHLNPDYIPRQVYKGARPSFADTVPFTYRGLAHACWAADPQRRPKAADLVTVINGQLLEFD